MLVAAAIATVGGAASGYVAHEIVNLPVEMVGVVVLAVFGVLFMTTSALSSPTKKKKRKSKKATPAPEPVVEKKPKKKSKKRSKKKKEVVAVAEPVPEPEPVVVEPVPEPEPEPVAEPVKLTKNQKKRLKAKAKKQAEAEAEAAMEKETEKVEEDLGWTTQTSKNSRKKSSKVVETPKVEEDPVETLKQGSVDINVASMYYGLIKGKNGDTLALLEEATSCSITIPGKNAQSSWIVIRGPTDGCAKAKLNIEQLIAKGYSNITHPGRTENSVTIPKKMRGVVIGPGGMNLKMIQETTGVKVNMPEKDSSSNVVTIQGSDEGVTQAKKAIEDLVKDGFSSITHPDWVKSEIPFPTILLSKLIGSSGSNIRRLQDATGCKINTGSSDNVVVIGAPEGVREAKKEIMDLMKPEEFEDPDPEWSNIDPTIYDW